MRFLDSFLDEQKIYKYTVDDFYSILNTNYVSVNNKNQQETKQVYVIKTRSDLI